MEIKVYENGGGGITVIIYKDGHPTSVMAGFEIGWSREEFIKNVLNGFGDDEYDPDEFGGARLEDVANGVHEEDDLIAEIIPEKEIVLHVSAMGFAGKELFGIPY